MLSVGVVALLTKTPLAIRHVADVIGGLCVGAWFVELVTAWWIGRRAGSLKATAKQVRQMTDGPVVRGGIFGSWPQRSRQFGALLDGVSLLVQARDDALVATYLRHGAMQPNPDKPRHILWLAP